MRVEAEAEAEGEGDDDDAPAEGEGRLAVSQRRCRWYAISSANTRPSPVLSSAVPSPPAVLFRCLSAADALGTTKLVKTSP